MTTDATAAPTRSLGDPDPEVQDVKIRMLGPGHAEVLLHGVDIAPDLVGFQLTAPSPGEVPELVLMLGARAATKAQYEGMAHVVLGDPPDVTTAAAQFLEAMDAEQVQKAALARDLGPGPYATTEAILAQLIEWARGRA